MTQAKTGDTVKVHYTGKLQNGEVFDTSKEREPLEFTIGGGQIIPGFEEAVVGMNEGDKKTETVPKDKAYGQRREEMVQTVDSNQFPDDIDPQVGQQYQVKQPNNQTVIVTVTNIEDDKITLDANHPLAGQDLEFDIELLEIV